MTDTSILQLLNFSHHRWWTMFHIYIYFLFYGLNYMQIINGFTMHVLNFQCSIQSMYPLLSIKHAGMDDSTFYT